MLEQAGEMMGKIETQQAGCLADVMTLHQQTFRLIYNIVVNVADGRPACGPVDDVTEVTWRIGQLGGTPGDSGQALRQLAVLAEVGLQQIVEALQQVGFSPILFRQLAQVDAVAVFQYQSQVGLQHFPQRRRILMYLQLLSHLRHQLRDREPFIGLHAQRTVEEIGEELITVYLSFQL